MARRPSRQTRSTNETGTAVVELAVLLPLLLAIVFGVMDFARVLNYVNEGTNIANEGARWAIVNQNPGSGTLQAYIRAQGDTPEFTSNSTICINFLNGGSRAVGDPVEVKVKTTFTWLPFIGSLLGGATNLTTVASAQMRIEQSPDSSSIPSGDGGTAGGGRTCP